MAAHDKSIDRQSSRKIQSNDDSLDTNKADTEMWLFKAPQPAPGYPSRSVAKVTISVDPLKFDVNADDNSSAAEVTMELTGSDSENALSAYSLNKSTDFNPMSVFSESTQGKVTVEGKIVKRFDMKPQNVTRYEKLYQERNHKRETERQKAKVIEYVPEEEHKSSIGHSNK